MTVSAKQMTERLSPAERKAVEKRAAERMKVGQETVSKIESQNKDMRVSDVAKYLAALGGELELVARFPDRMVMLCDLTPVRRARRAKAPKAKRQAAAG